MSHVPTVLKSDRTVFDKMLPVDDNASARVLPVCDNELLTKHNVNSLLAVSTVLVFYTMQVSVVQTHTHTKRHRISQNNDVVSLTPFLSASPAIVRNACILNLLKFVFIC